MSEVDLKSMITDELLEKSAHVYIQARRDGTRKQRFGKEATQYRKNIESLQKAFKRLDTVWNKFSDLQKEMFIDSLPLPVVRDFFDSGIDLSKGEDGKWKHIPDPLSAIEGFERGLTAIIPMTSVDISVDKKKSDKKKSGKGDSTHAKKMLTLYLLEYYQRVSEVPLRGYYRKEHSGDDTYHPMVSWCAKVCKNIYDRREMYGDESAHTFLEELKSLGENNFDAPVEEALRFLKSQPN
ncbi:MAG: hypothetical protein VX154_07615 [Pseudomonadota bacterium]|nr:hypothetical protein [Pseudomonadota bacterium]